MRLAMGIGERLIHYCRTLLILIGAGAGPRSVIAPSKLQEKDCRPSLTPFSVLKIPPVEDPFTPNLSEKGSWTVCIKKRFAFNNPLFEVSREAKSDLWSTGITFRATATCDLEHQEALCRRILCLGNDTYRRLESPNTASTRVM